jgi:hypothetical protein
MSESDFAIASERLRSAALLRILRVTEKARLRLTHDILHQRREMTRRVDVAEEGTARHAASAASLAIELEGAQLLIERMRHTFDRQEVQRKEALHQVKLLQELAASHHQAPESSDVILESPQNLAKGLVKFCSMLGLGGLNCDFASAFRTVLESECFPYEPHREAAPQRGASTEKHPEKYADFESIEAGLHAALLIVQSAKDLQMQQHHEVYSSHSIKRCPLTPFNFVLEASAI